MANILITGGTGFIGSYVSRKLLDEGHRVVCFDNVPEPFRGKIVGEKAIFHCGDISRIESIISAVKEYEIEKIVSLAFLMPEIAEKNLQLAAQVNVLGVNNVFEAARLCGIKRVIYSSSISCYGNVSWYGDRVAQEVPEDFHPPNNVYSAAKQYNEFIAGRYNQYHQMEIICIRISIVFGYGRIRGVNTYLDDMVSNSARNIGTHVPRRSSQKVCLIYVKDLAEIFWKLLMAQRVKHWVYNSGRHTVSIGEFGQIVKRVIPKAEFTFEELASPMYLVHAIDDSRLKEEFDLTCNSLEENIIDQIILVRKAEGLGCSQSL